MAEGAGGAGKVYSELIAAELTEERARKQSLEQRGIAVITTSATLLTLLVGIAAVAGGDLIKGHGLNLWASVAVTGALALFALAAVAGLATNQARAYEEADPEDLKRLVSEQYWAGHGSTASRRVAEMHVNVLADARRVNDGKAFRLKWALRLETGGVVCLALGVGAAVAGW